MPWARTLAESACGRCVPAEGLAVKIGCRTPSNRKAPVPAFESILRIVHERWQRGVEDFTNLLSSGPTKLPNKKTVRSAIYGNMEFDGPEMRFIESFYLQRLRNVSQMGLLHLVYPDARHSRFEHSLGVLHSLKGLLSADQSVREALSEVERRTLFMASLLHDCGHGPFSHTTETLLENAGLDILLRPPQDGEGDGVKPHERRCRDMIQGTDFHLANLGLGSYGLSEALRQFDVEPAAVVDVILGKKPSLLLNLLSGHFDVDKMDYFRRDAFFTGTLGGGVDMEAMQRWVRIRTTNAGHKTASYDARLVGHLLHLLFSREHVYNVTAYHPASRIAAALVLVAGDLALRTLPPEVAADIFANIELCDDRELLSILELAAADGTHAETPILRRVIQRIHLRRLPKRLATLTRAEFIQAFASCITHLESEDKKLPPMVYTRLSDVGGGRYLRMLGEHAADDVAILELSPDLGPGAESQGVHSFSKEASTLRAIFITHSVASPPLALWDWLEKNAGPGSAEAQALALRAYKLALWRALVLVPASLRIVLRERGEEANFVRDFSAALADSALCRPIGKTRTARASAIGYVGRKLSVWRAPAPSTLEVVS